MIEPHIHLFLLRFSMLRSLKEHDKTESATKGFGTFNYLPLNLFTDS